MYAAYSREATHHECYYFSWVQRAHLASRIYATRGSLCVVGHSYGGDTALDVAYKYPKREIDLLVTLDPVARFTHWNCVREHVGWWVNVRVDPTGPGNAIAVLGGHYGPRPGANQDIDLGRSAAHGDADELFKPVAPLVSRFHKHDFHAGGGPACAT